ncbi:MAG: GxxExxY protein [Acidobacteriota bacterium]
MAPIPETTDRIATEIVDAAFAVHRALGPGLLEGVYETCLCHEMSKRGLHWERQVALPVCYDGLRLESALRLDLLVENLVIVELKATEKLLPIHEAQVLTYLKLLGRRLGFLINFNSTVLKNGVRRLAL